MAESKPLLVGSTVRARLPDSKFRRRATIATVQSDTACLLWEDNHHESTSSRRPPLVSPVFADEDYEHEEATVPLSDISPLFDFETNHSHEGIGIKDWKQRGDELLKIGDAEAASWYYELGLQQSSHLEIGSTVIVKTAKGRAVVADVDCIEGRMIEVVFDTNEEETIPKQKVMLTLLQPDNDELQDRMLLNMARCMMQMSETCSMKRRPSYLKAAVLACTLANTSACFREKPQTTSLLLRAKAYASLSKFPHALADIKKLLSISPDQNEGQRLKREIERQQKQQQKAEKKLVKDICSLVQTSTTETVRSPTQPTLQPQQKLSHTKWYWTLVVILLAWLFQKAFS
jgi:hypothetical protein